MWREVEPRWWEYKHRRYRAYTYVSGALWNYTVLRGRRLVHTGTRVTCMTAKQAAWDKILSDQRRRSWLSRA